MIKASRYIELVLGSLLAPEIDMIFGNGIGASLIHFFSLRTRSIIYEKYIYIYEDDIQRLLYVHRHNHQDIVIELHTAEDITTYQEYN